MPHPRPLASPRTATAAGTAGDGWETYLLPSVRAVIHGRPQDIDPAVIPWVWPWSATEDPRPGKPPAGWLTPNQELLRTAVIYSAQVWNVGGGPPLGDLPPEWYPLPIALGHLDYQRGNGQMYLGPRPDGSYSWSEQMSSIYDSYWALSVCALLLAAQHAAESDLERQAAGWWQSQTALYRLFGIEKSSAGWPRVLASGSRSAEPWTSPRDQWRWWLLEGQKPVPAGILKDSRAAADHEAMRPEVIDALRYAARAALPESTGRDRASVTKLLPRLRHTTTVRWGDGDDVGSWADDLPTTKPGAVTWTRSAGGSVTWGVDRPPTPPTIPGTRGEATMSSRSPIPPLP